MESIYNNFLQKCTKFRISIDFMTPILFSQTFDFLKYIISQIGFLESGIDFTNF